MTPAAAITLSLALRGLDPTIKVAWLSSGTALDAVAVAEGRDANEALPTLALRRTPPVRGVLASWLWACFMALLCTPLPFTPPLVCLESSSAPALSAFR